MSQLFNRDRVLGAIFAACAFVAVPAAVAREAARISHWVPVGFSDLPGFFDDPLNDAWQALVQGCTKPVRPWTALCADFRRLSWADDEARRFWLMQSLQAFRVEQSAAPQSITSLLSAYFEPVLQAQRVASAEFAAPVSGLQNRVLFYLRDPVDVMQLQVQGSGRVQVVEANGESTQIRVLFAGSNGLPFRSAGRWLLDQGLTRNGSWEGVRAWLAQNPDRLSELIAANPRRVFFREKPLSDHATEAGDGPLGAQGVPLTAGRSIAVDPRSIPLGTPVWLSSSGVGLQTHRLVVAQDVGGAILGAVRADYFVGSGDEAAAQAQRIKQSVKLWVLWPRDAPRP